MLESVKEEMEKTQAAAEKMAREQEELRKDLAEEQKERASLLARVNSGGGIKKKSLVSSIIQWDKENPEGLPENFEEEDKNKEKEDQKRASEYSFDYKPEPVEEGVQQRPKILMKGLPLASVQLNQNKGSRLWGKATSRSKEEGY